MAFRQSIHSNCQIVLRSSHDSYSGHFKHLRQLSADFDRFGCTHSMSSRFFLFKRSKTMSSQSYKQLGACNRARLSCSLRWREGTTRGRIFRNLEAICVFQQTCLLLFCVGFALKISWCIAAPFWSHIILGRDLPLDHSAFEGQQEPEALRHLAVEASGPLLRRVQKIRSLLQAE